MRNNNTVWGWPVYKNTTHIHPRLHGTDILHTHRCQSNKWKPHSRSLYRVTVTVGEHTGQKPIWPRSPTVLYVRVRAHVSVPSRLTGEYLKSVWSTLREEEPSECLCHGGGGGWLPPLHSTISFASLEHGDSKVMEEVCQMWKQHTHTYLVGTQTQEMVYCCQSRGAEETLDEVMAWMCHLLRVSVLVCLCVCVCVCERMSFSVEFLFLGLRHD